MKISPLGKVPVLQVNNTVLFESSVICEYLDETHGQILHPSDPLEKAKHRAWMEFSSVLLGLLYNIAVTTEETEFQSRRMELQEKLGSFEAAMGRGPYFEGNKFTMVDAFMGPVFRYFQAFAQWGDSSYLAEFPKLQAWESNVMRRPSVLKAVPSDYSEKLKKFLKSKNGLYSRRLQLDRSPG